MLIKLKQALIDFRDDIQATPQKYVTLFGSMCIMASLGVIHTIGALSPYYISYLRTVREQDNVRYSKTIYILSVQNTFVAIAAVLSGVLRNRFLVNLKVISSVGALLLASALFLSFLTLQHSFALFILSQGVLFGNCLF